MVLEILRLSEEDTDKACEISQIFHLSNTHKSKALDFLKNKHNYLLGCYVDKVIVGFLLAYELQRFDEKNSMLYLHEIQVLEDYRGKGIGSILIENLKKYCKENNFSKIFLITNKSNNPAIKLYEKTGGTNISNDDIVYKYE